MEQENIFSDVDSEIENNSGSELESDLDSDIDNELESESENIDYKTIDKPNASNSDTKNVSNTKHTSNSDTKHTSNSDTKNVSGTKNTNQKSNSRIKTKRSVRFSKKIEFDDKPLNKLSNKSIVTAIAYKSNLRKNKTDDVLFSKSIVTPASKSMVTPASKSIVTPASKSIVTLASKSMVTPASTFDKKRIVADKNITAVQEQSKKTDLLTIKQQFEKMIMSYPTLAEMITIQEIIAELEVYQEQHRKFRASLAVIIDWLKTPNMINLCKAKAKVAALNMIYDDGTKFLQHINDKFDEIKIDI